MLARTRLVVLIGAVALVPATPSGAAEGADERRPDTTVDQRSSAFEPIGRAFNLTRGSDLHNEIIAAEPERGDDGLHLLPVPERVGRDHEGPPDGRDHAGQLADRRHPAGGDQPPAHISADGRFVAYFSLATNLVPDDDQRHDQDIFLYDAVTGQNVR